jgi:hypothetical protein
VITPSTKGIIESSIMFDQMPLLVDQVNFGKSFNNSSNLNSNLNRKTCNKFWIPNSNSNLKLHFMGWTWAHTLHLTLVYNTVVHLNLHRAQTMYLRWHLKLGFLIRVTHHRNTLNLGNVNLIKLMHNVVNLIMNALQCIWWHDTFLITITPGVLHGRTRLWLLWFLEISCWLVSQLLGDLVVAS